MRTRLALALTLIVSLAQAEEVKMRLMIDGKRSGTATYGHTLGGDGSLAAWIEMKFVAQKVPMSGYINFSFDKTGRPISYGTRISYSGTSQAQTVTYGPNAVMVQEEIGGKRSQRGVKIPAGRRLESAGAFWFIRHRPTPGAVDKSWTYDTEKKKWTEQIVRYVGPKKIKIGAKEVTAHELLLTVGTFWVDNKGLPYRIAFEAGEMPFLFERVM